MRSSIVLVIALALLGGCVGRLEAPAIDRVEPALVSNLTDTPVRVRGRNFYLDAHADLGGDVASVDGAIAVALGDTTLASVVRLDPGTLDVVVPRGTAPGIYDIVVTTAGGAQARATGALTVTPEPIGSTVGPGPRLAIVDAAGVEVGDVALTTDELLTLRVVGRDGFGDPTGPVAATWSVAGVIGTVDAMVSAGVAFDPVRPGVGAVIATVPGLGSDATGSITVVSGRAAALSIAPPTVTCSAGDAPIAFTAAATDADGNPTLDVGTLAWTIATGPIATVDGASGLMTPIRAGIGRLEVTSSHGGRGRSGDVTVTGGAQLSAGLAMPVHAALGDTFEVTMTVTNGGAADAGAVTPSPLIATGGLIALAGPTPAAADVAIGDVATFTWSYRAATAGRAQLRGAAAGTDAAWATPVTSAPAAATISLGAPARLDATLELPTTTGRDAPFTATMTVANRGEASATMVAPSALALTGTAAAVLIGGPTPGPATITGGGQATFAWTYRATALGTLTVTGAAAGLDDNSGAPIAAPAVSSEEMTITPVSLVASDPFDDSTRAPQVFVHGGAVYLGPNRDGTGLMRFAADGSGGASVGLAFGRDATGHLSRNSSPAPFASIGTTGCGHGSAACGPDDEDGRGRFGSATLAGQDWLVAGGGRSDGDLDYVHLTSEAGPTLAFAYVDLDGVLGSGASALSAVHVLGDRLYLGFSESGGGRPGLLALVTTPTAPGLDAIAGVDVLDLSDAGIAGAGGPSMIDAMADLGGLLYVASARGWVRSTVIAPRPSSIAPGDWSLSTPSAAEYAQLASRATAAVVDLDLTDRAVPQMAVFGGRLFAGRNTVAGPQLWACTPAATGDVVGCDPADWTLVAGNLVGDVRLTQLGDPDNATISLVLATATYLYVGFDNASGGLRLYRTSLATPAAAAFEGPLGEAGFGSSGRRQILSAAAVADGIFVVAGHGVGAASLWRVSD